MAYDEERIDWQKQRAWDDLRSEHEQLFSKLGAYDFDDETQAIMDTVRNSLRNALSFVESKGPKPLPFEDLVTDSSDGTETAEVPSEHDLPTKPIAPKGEGVDESAPPYEDLLTETTDDLIKRRDAEWRKGRMPLSGVDPLPYDDKTQPERYPTEGMDRELDGVQAETQKAIMTLKDALYMMVDRINEIALDVNDATRDIYRSSWH